MRASSRRRRLLVVATTLLALASTSCLPADTRPVPGSVLLTVTSGDAPAVPTVDGWSIAVDRLVVGVGGAAFDHTCDRYSDTIYGRLIDATLHEDQKINIIYGLGQCGFQFPVAWPQQDTVLGKGVTEADLEAMQSVEEPSPERPPIGISVDFAARATRGTETKRLHWQFRQYTSYMTCSPRRAEDGFPLPLVLESNENLTIRTTVRGTVLFADNAPVTDSLRFDPMAAADTIRGDNDGDVTLEELGKVTIEEARNFGGLYEDPEGSKPNKLADYVHQVLFLRIVEFPEHFGCKPRLGSPPHPE